jgi:hypothetical protein
MGGMCPSLDKGGRGGASLGMTGGPREYPPDDSGGDALSVSPSE